MTTFRNGTDRGGAGFACKLRMLHAHTARVLDEWRLRRAGRRLPPRTEMSPMLFGPLLPQLFILGEGEAGWAFRLAGGFLNDLHGRELRQTPYLELWAERDRRDVVAAIDAARRAAEPVVLKARGYADAERQVGLEIMLAPLTGPTEAPDRVLGLYQPTSLTARLMGLPLQGLALEGVDGAPGAEPEQRRASLRLVVDNTR